MNTMSRRWTLGLAAVALGVLGACGALFGQGPHVPGAYQGTTPITVVNAWDRELCAFTIFQSAAESDNWLGTRGKQQNLAPGERRTFNIKPGVYHVLGGFCHDGQTVAASGTYGAATVTIQGPSLIALGPNPVQPSPGAQTLAFAKVYFPQQNPGGGGGEAPAEASQAEAPDSSSSSDDSSSAAESSGATAEPSGATTTSDPSCKPSGATCDQSYQCCSGACVTHSPDDYCR